MPCVLRYTLVSEGSSDQLLLRPIDWLLRQHVQYLGCVPEGRWADLSVFPSPPRNLAQKCRFALKMYPCDLLFVHRDADTGPREVRADEIRRALACAELCDAPGICVIPVRMTEAWFLFDEAAIRQASGNPRGSVSLHLPAFPQIEAEPDPKQVLYDALRNASELHGRRRKKFRPQEAIHRLAELITDYTPLQQLSAFAALEHELRQTIRMPRDVEGR